LSRDASQAEPLVPNADTIALCEQFIGQIILRREFTEAIDPCGRWERLAHTPVVEITRTNRSADQLATDIDSSGDGWVRPTSEKRGEPLSVTYIAGMADSLEDVPAPLVEGMKRLAAWEASGETGEPPAAVAAMWRPYRRLRLS
jgi:hypothetical protein